MAPARAAAPLADRRRVGVAAEHTTPHARFGAMRPAVSPSGELKVLLLARYGWLGASSRIRHYAYIEPLAKLGVRVESQHLIDDVSLLNFYANKPRRWSSIAAAYLRRARLLREAGRYDVLWIEKEVFPGLPFSLERRAYATPGVATILDFDDFWPARHDDGTERQASRGRKLAKLRNAVGAATLVTAANSELADALAAETGRRPEVCANRVDIQRYRTAATAAEIPQIGPPRPLKVGWIGTPYTAARYLPAVTPALNRLNNAGLADIVLIGADAAAPDLQAHRLAWSLGDEARSIAMIDVGIQPLGSGEFDRRKSGWKIFQYMAAGKPVVVHRTAFVEEIVKDGVTGYVVDTEDAFERRLRQLAADRGLCARMGAAGQAFIAERFDIKDGAARIADLLRSAARQAKTRLAP